MADMEPVTIASLELENVKRVRAVSLEPTPTGLTVIGGRNAQGKTSVLDAIAWALGGDRRRPAKPDREGSATPARLHVELSNGLMVERRGKNGSLTVTDPSGKRAGQMLLNSFIESLALDLPKFMNMSDSEKANVLLGIIGVGDRLAEIDAEVRDAEDERRGIGRDARAAKVEAEKMPSFPDAPKDPVTPSELIREQQDILARNGENQRKRENAAKIGRDLNSARASVASRKKMLDNLRGQVETAEKLLSETQETARRLEEDYRTACKTAEDLQDESTAEVEEKLAEIDRVNEEVRANQRKADMEDRAERLSAEYKRATAEIDQLRRDRTALLDGVEMPLDGLTVEDGALLYNGSVWSDMSAAEQLRVAAAIVHSLKPECGFVLVDKLEQMDAQTLVEFGAWAESQGLQVIGTRVATDGTCTVVIEDGRIEGPTEPRAAGPVKNYKSLEKGVF